MHDSFLARYSGYLFPVFWCLISWGISRVTGWGALAERHPDRPMADGKSFRFCTAGFGKSVLGPRYGQCLFLRVGNEGVRLSVFLPFRIGHPPMFLPWEAIESVTPHKIFFRNYYAINIDGKSIKVMGAPGEFIHSKCLEMKGFK